MHDSPTRTRAASLSVRFEDTCVLIPLACTPSKSGLIRPRLITKSYSLPLWKSSSKKSPAPPPPAATPERDADVEKDRAEKRLFSLTVSVPSLTTKSKPRRPSLPLPSPCLSRRYLSASQSSDASSPPTSPTSPAAPPFVAPPLRRSPSVPQIQPASLKEAETLVTIPLRPCCEACHSCVDAALAGGERWAEKWSSGAVRRYSEGEHVHLHQPHPAVFGVTRVWTHEPDTDTGSLRVDEVEVKRRSSDLSHAMLNNRPIPLSTGEDAMADSDDEEACQDPTHVPALCRVAVLQEEEEDEDLLFPLPSPRRSPSTTPNPTPPGSQVALAVLASGSQTNLTVLTDLPPRAETPPPVSAPPVLSPPVSALPVPPPPARTTSPPTSPSSVYPELASPPASPTRTRQRSTSPTATRQPRRPSFSSASGSLLKGSASILKGVAAGMTGANVGVVR